MNHVAFDIGARVVKPGLMVVQDALDNPQLARGLVREELRPLKLQAKRPQYADTLKLMKALTERHMHEQGKFSAPTAKKLLKQLVRSATEHRTPVREFDAKIHVFDSDPTATPMHGFFYWATSQAEVQLTREDKLFIGDFVELRCMRVGASKRRLMIDDAFCHFFASEHCLLRMLERGAVGREPLKLMSQRLDTLLPAAVMLATVYTAELHNGYPNILLPFGDGVLLCKMSLFDITDDMSNWHRFRAVSDKDWLKRTTSFDAEPLLVHRKSGIEGIVSIYAATYIPFVQMSSEQIWAKMQVEKLIEEEKDNLSGYEKMVYQLEDLEANTAKNIRSLLPRLHKLMNNQRWKVATSAALMQAS